MRSGHFNLTISNGVLRHVSYYGYDWSSSTYSAVTRAYNLDIGTEVNVSGPGARYSGFPLRCLSTVLGMNSG